ncbi:hypothetical protein HMPREF3031_06290 [Staphylococcus sp. HMSC072B07]|uniref:helix-turn-helix domain-containing protein n=1 Tax=Staphylococcus TaxID=1279 RepID=UPI0008A37D74|nr:MULTISPECIES: XRE family transcriptional regulator [Staphylococcus]MDK8175345.1 XRE family transcriptional regulator [Staphylococcus simulans]OFO48085.1 hypothetical protein HMPREF3031_06290 [Staphylococcus sp. HMSC072B07]OHR06993.1 hypothetical protein HMPREF2721_10590 [Staphylococcus sp. HMSC078A12]PNZ42323.1 helix-turn-helix domain-containing protein [Staphylococcus simulans]SQE74907.1 phage transcriptional regulator [Staphylococcus simulans]
MTSFSSNLERLMNKRDMSDSDLANLVDVNRTTVTRWRKGIRSPKLDKLPEIANIFGVEPLDLVSENNKNKVIEEINTTTSQLTPPRQHNVLDFANKQLEEQNNEVSENDRNIITIKRMHAAAAGVVGEELFDDLIEEDVEFYEDEVPKGADFCILVNGDSMEPMIKEGTYAFIKRETNIKDGTIALVVLDGTSFIKRVDIHPEYLKLISLNPKYEDITVSSFNDLKVVGKIVL